MIDNYSTIMMKWEKILRKKLKALVRIHAYIILIFFVLYIFVSLIAGMSDFISNLPLIISGDFSTEQRSHLSVQILHDLAFTLILYKAFIVFLSYAKTLHINIKLILELAIIAPIIELIFNFHGLSYIASMIYALIAIGISGIYLFFYKQVQLTEEDHLKE